MKHYRTIAAIMILLTNGWLAAAPLPLTDNTAPPYMGLYEGPPPKGISYIDEYAKMLNRTVVWGHAGVAWDNWDNVSGGVNGRALAWLLPPWGKWMNEDPRRVFVLSTTMLPWPTEANGNPTLALGATGAYNKYFESLAKLLVANKLADRTILRVGWEFNASWYPWKVMTAEDAGNYAAYWRQIVTTMRAVPGADKLQFNWNGCNESCKYPLEAAYPGDQYVDQVGMDVYDVSWNKDTYPYPENATAEERLVRQKKTWDTWIYPVSPKNGIAAWLAVAKAHHKPLTFPEWGLGYKKDGHGGGDNPYFIQQMFNVIQDPDNNIYFASYWDAKEAKIIPTGGFVSPYPQSTALFLKLFSLPAMPPAAATPAAAVILPTTEPVKNLELALDNNLTLKLVLIPAGKFIMGAPENEQLQFHAPNEGPQHEVTISKPFYMSIYTVTQEQYESVMEKNPSRYKGPTLPVQPMSWEDISGWCAKLSEKTGKKVRIPTEAEWEYACRAGTQTTWFWGNDQKAGDDYGWFGLKEPKPVGGKQPNPWGLYDMAGNVSQVCSDLGAMYPKATLPYAAGPVTDPTGPTEGSTQHVCRGQGGWIGHSRSAGHRGAFANIQAGDHLYSIRLVVEAPNPNN